MKFYVVKGQEPCLGKHSVYFVEEQEQMFMATYKSKRTVELNIVALNPNAELERVSCVDCYNSNYAQKKIKEYLSFKAFETFIDNNVVFDGDMTKEKFFKKLQEK